MSAEKLVQENDNPDIGICEECTGEINCNKENYILTDDVKKALEFSIKNKCAVKIYTMDKSSGCYKLSDECLG